MGFSGPLIFGLVKDVSKAHRRCLHRPEQLNELACQTRSDSDVIWLNKTGTFGVASAAFWFSRWIGLVGRLSFRAMLEAVIFVLIYADDLHLLSGGKERWLHLRMMLALMRVQGTPFPSRKWRGGLQATWLDTGWTVVESTWESRRSAAAGEVTAYLPWSSGCLTLPQVSWKAWLHVSRPGMGTPHPGPGLCLACGGAVLSLPNLIRCALEFVWGHLRAGARTYPVGVIDTDLGEVFHADADCNDDLFILGGWFLRRGSDPSKAPWFQLALSPEDAPWLFKDGSSSWSSTSSELLSFWSQRVS